MSAFHVAARSTPDGWGVAVKLPKDFPRSESLDKGTEFVFFACPSEDEAKFLGEQLLLMFVYTEKRGRLSLPR